MMMHRIVVVTRPAFDDAVWHASVWLRIRVHKAQHIQGMKSITAYSVGSLPGTVTKLSAPCSPVVVTETVLGRCRYGCDKSMLRQLL